MPHTNHGCGICDAARGSGGIVTDGHDASRAQQDNELLEQFFAGSPLTRIVLPVGERISRFVRMKREDVPEEDASLNVFQHAPYDCGGSFSHSGAYRRPLGHLIEIPTPSMLGYVDVVRQC